MNKTESVVKKELQSSSDDDRAIKSRDSYVSQNNSSDNEDLTSVMKQIDKKKNISVFYFLQGNS